MKLYYHPASTVSRMVMLFAAEEGIGLDYVLVDLMTGAHHQPAYKAINPNALVPVLDDDGFVLTESSAILRYLAGKTASRAYPTDLQARARVDEAMAWFYGNYYKDYAYGLVYPQLFPHHRRPTDAGHAETIEWGRRQSLRWLDVLDTHVLGRDNAFLCGDSISLADYVGIEMVTLGELVGCTLKDYPNVRGWIGRMKALPHWNAVHEAHEGFVASLAGRDFVAI
jgi:glutathione S-transferase